MALLLGVAGGFLLGKRASRWCPGSGGFSEEVQSRRYAAPDQKQASVPGRPVGTLLNPAPTDLRCTPGTGQGPLGGRSATKGVQQTSEERRDVNADFHA